MELKPPLGLPVPKEPHLQRRDANYRRCLRTCMQLGLEQYDGQIEFREVIDALMARADAIREQSQLEESLESPDTAARSFRRSSLGGEQLLPNQCSERGKVSNAWQAAVVAMKLERERSQKSSADGVKPGMGGNDDSCSNNMASTQAPTKAVDARRAFAREMLAIAVKRLRESPTKALGSHERSTQVRSQAMVHSSGEVLSSPPAPAFGDAVPPFQAMDARLTVAPSCTPPVEQVHPENVEMKAGCYKNDSPQSECLPNGRNVAGHTHRTIADRRLPSPSTLPSTVCSAQQIRSHRPTPRCQARSNSPSFLETAPAGSALHVQQTCQPGVRPKSARGAVRVSPTPRACSPQSARPRHHGPVTVGQSQPSRVPRTEPSRVPRTERKGPSPNPQSQPPCFSGPSSCAKYARSHPGPRAEARAQMLALEEEVERIRQTQVERIRQMPPGARMAPAHCAPTISSSPKVRSKSPPQWSSTQARHMFGGDDRSSRMLPAPAILPGPTHITDRVRTRSSVKRIAM